MFRFSHGFLLLYLDCVIKNNNFFFSLFVYIRHYRKWAIHFAQVDVSCSLWTSRDHIQSVALTIRKPCKSSMSGSLLKITVPVTSCGLDGHRLSTVPAAARKSRG